MVFLYFFSSKRLKVNKRTYVKQACLRERLKAVSDSVITKKIIYQRSFGDID